MFVGQHGSKASVPLRSIRAVVACVGLIVAGVVDGCATVAADSPDRLDASMDAVEQQGRDANSAADARTDTQALDAGRRADANPFFDGQFANRDVRVAALPESGVELPTAAGLVGASSSQTVQIDVREYFPRPAVGQTIINEFAYTAMVNGVATAIPYSVQRYERSPDGRYYFLEDFLITAAGRGTLEWLDTWVYTSDERGVLEVYDSAPTWTFSAFANPLNHGILLTKNVAFTCTSFEDGQDGRSNLNDYWIMLQDVKSTLTLPAGTFREVAMQAESQLKCTTEANCARMPRLIDEPNSVRYRFFFAPGRGIIAQQWFDMNWNPNPGGGFLYAYRSCIATTADYVCP